MRRMGESAVIAAFVYKQLTEVDERKIQGVTLQGPPSNGMWAFRLRFDDTKWGLSVSYPPDAMPPSIETALWHFGNSDEGDMCYVSKWGYDDIQRHGRDVRDLVTHIEEMRKLVTTPGADQVKTSRTAY